jgi:hypothetical protein
MHYIRVASGLLKSIVVYRLKGGARFGRSQLPSFVQTIFYAPHYTHPAYSHCTPSAATMHGVATAPDIRSIP